MFSRKKSSPGNKVGTQDSKDDNCAGIDAILAAIKKLYPDQDNHVQTNTIIKSW